MSKVMLPDSKQAELLCASYSTQSAAAHAQQLCMVINAFGIPGRSEPRQLVPAFVCQR